MKTLDIDLKNFGVNSENIENEFGSKVVGVVSNLGIKNENEKCFGRVILLLNPGKKYLVLNQKVEFYEKNIKYKWSRFHDNDGFYIIGDYWVKAYNREIHIEVPIKVLDYDTNKVITIMRELTYKQFQENRLNELYRNVAHRYVAAYNNFKDLFKNNQYGFAINATVRNCRISKDELLEFLSRIDNRKKTIKKEWVTYLNYKIQNDETELMIQNQLNKIKMKGNNKNNVINI